MDVIASTTQTVDERVDTIARVLEAVFPGAAYVLIMKSIETDQACIITNINVAAVKHIMDEAFTALQAYDAKQAAEG